MKLFPLLAAGALMAAAPTFAGDIEAGEKDFKKCKACHMVVSADGEEIYKGGKTGPNLYGVFGRQAGSLEGFKYGKDLVAAGAAGLVWDEAQFVEYVQNPAAFLKANLNKPNAVAKMAFKLKDAATAEDVYAYLAQFGAAPAATE